MVRLRRFSSAVIAAVMISMIPFSSAGAGATRSSAGGICEFLASIISDPNADPTVKAVARFYFDLFDC